MSETWCQLHVSCSETKGQCGVQWYCSQLTCSFCLVQVHQFEFRPKCIYIAVIIRKMLEAMLNTDAVDDKVNC